ncbi:transcription termination factor MTERF4, chloroplastic-like [Anneissia japonica]|uniref:transcription termination factor MTERF4, chloroplastic-like n=1 Tax=Anneissia japonica TaxID=1529436 RepID=UPI001425B6D1|nr:transcription termination factor MTERF4, chloroplastic-like [Anneissia japonica]XP_033106936.1 transcription termination factor MTERF4, chloroplastic-like [Anneissia japonica]XP_033106943.1 transcription termination factor MTERF4, chloroplastic-like [Anneissia japonica]XP_033106952.1 transcription termination factor MTERF4, chloroplastic-like [Anneissia japonica]XP_033106961.1 transcription termination factor MTERF4, chloroplastic-like [Anneissia japonica]XP_033106968.1 transcription termin
MAKPKATYLVPRLAQLFIYRVTCCSLGQRQLTTGYKQNISALIQNRTTKNNYFLSSGEICIKRTISDKKCQTADKVRSTTTQAKEYLYKMGFDTKRIEDKRPTTLKGNLNHIQSNIQFFRNFNLDDKAIQSVVLRQPGLLSVSLDHLHDHVNLLQKYNLTFEQIGQVMNRAPKFFSVPIETIQGNVRYAEKLQVTKKKIGVILLHYPTTFSRKIDGIELVCTQILDILKTHVKMDVDLSRKMLRSMLMTCPKVFVRSPGEIFRNIEFLESLGFTQKALYTMVRFCPETMRVYPHYIQTKFDFVQKLFNLNHKDTVTLITRYPKFINFQPKILQLKADNIQSVGFTLQQIRDQPRVFSFSISTFNRRYKALSEAGYEFKTLRLLTLSEGRIEDEVRRLTCTEINKFENSSEE